MNKVCLSSAYLAPIEYYICLYKFEHILLENKDNYIKQTYRNRCRILTSNGTMDLIIPVDKPSGEKILTKDIRILSADDWQTKHWRAIESAYNSSPFFEYYKDDLISFYEKKWIFLWDFNQALQEKITELLELKPEVDFTDEFITVYDENVRDLRESIHPKKAGIVEHPVPYYQVFEQKFGFIPNLSIIDLLFNMGNESILILDKTEINI